MKVYCVFGLGFGDDEDSWELVSVCATLHIAEGVAADFKDAAMRIDEMDLLE
jgi:hypothetical protein